MRIRFVGIDVAAERHVVAVVDESGRVLLKATPFTEDADGYAKLLGMLGVPDALVAMEATGHYWKNLFAALVAAGFAVARLNPLRTRRFAGEDLQWTQTAAIDAVGIARFAAQKRPPASRLPDRATEELRELVRFRDSSKIASWSSGAMPAPVSRTDTSMTSSPGAARTSIRPPSG